MLELFTRVSLGFTFIMLLIFHECEFQKKKNLRLSQKKLSHSFLMLCHLRMATTTETVFTIFLPVHRKEKTNKICQAYIFSLKSTLAKFEYDECTNPKDTFVKKFYCARFVGLFTKICLRPISELDWTEGRVATLPATQNKTADDSNTNIPWRNLTQFEARYRLASFL